MNKFNDRRVYLLEYYVLIVMLICGYLAITSNNIDTPMITESTSSNVNANVPMEPIDTPLETYAAVYTMADLDLLDEIRTK